MFEPGIENEFASPQPQPPYDIALLIRLRVKYATVLSSVGDGVLLYGGGVYIYNTVQMVMWICAWSRRLSSLGVYIIVKCIQGAPAPPRATLEAVWFRLRFVVCVLAFPPALYKTDSHRTQYPEIS